MKQVPMLLTRRCPVCEGKGTVLDDSVRVYCGRCGGAGVIAKP